MATKNLAELVAERRALTATLRDRLDDCLIARWRASENAEPFVLSPGQAEAHRAAEVALRKFDRRHPEVKAGMPKVL